MRLVSFVGQVDASLLSRVTLMALILVAPRPAAAQTYYARGSFYAGPSGVWSYDEGNRLYDDGLHGDGAAGDGVHAATVVSNVAPGLHQFKIGTADWSQLWPHNPEYPVTNAQLVTTLPGEAVFFRLDLSSRPGWQPETGAVSCDHGRPSGSVLELIGSAQELGAWNTGLDTVYDPETGVVRRTVTIATPGTYEYKFRTPGSWAWPFGLHYNMLIGDNFYFTSIEPDIPLRFLYDLRDGRSRVEPDDDVPTRSVTWGGLKARRAR